MSATASTKLAPETAGVKPGKCTRAVRGNPEWTIVCFFGAFWMAAIVVCPYYDLEHWPLTVGLAFGASAAGALPGFLFGLPRPAGPTSGAGDAASAVHANGTNLEQIADWLTKIVIGAGLVELKSLVPWFADLCAGIALEYGKSPPPSGFVGVWLTFYGIVGFFAAYNLTRVYLSPVYRDLEQIVRERVAPVIEEREKTEERMRALAAEGLRQLNPKASFLDSSTTSSEPRTVKSGRDPEDPQKGAFGGESTKNKYRLTARFFPLDRPNSKTGTAEISVEDTDKARSFEGAVVFHLHPTFDVPVVRVPIEDRRALMRITLWGGFTVGAVTPDGTRLELDLSQLPDAPQFVREL